MIYKFSKEAIFAWLSIKGNSNGEVDFSNAKRIDQYYIFENYPLAWTLIDCSFYKNWTFWGVFSKRLDFLSTKEFVSSDIYDISLWRQYICYLK